jgi:hypothetical protein
MVNNINEQISAIMSLKQRGMSPQQVMQMLVQQNPNIQQNIQTLQNMMNGKNPQEFVMQLAKQNGVNQQNMQFISQMFGK